MNWTEHQQAAFRHLMDLLSVEGLSGREAKVAAVVRNKLLAAGCQPDWIKTDNVHREIPGDFEMGNLIVKIPGRTKGPRLLFSSHLDTVPLCRGAVPVRDGMKIVAKGETGLGADNRTAVACMVALAERLLAGKKPFPPITLLFTVGEETGLWGSKFVTPASLGKPQYGFNIDAGDPAELCINAIGADRWEVDIRGISSHAGVHPEHGVSATLIASRAIATMARKGLFGKIKKGRNTGTSNVGIIQGGEATNQVTDHVYIKGESRSHRPDFLTQITEGIRLCFEGAAESVKNHRNETGSIDFRARRDYDAFHLGPGENVVNYTREIMRRMGVKLSLKVTNGGLDANNLNAKGIPTVTLGAGQHHPHTVEEYADLDEFFGGCELAWQLAVSAVMLNA